MRNRTIKSAVRNQLGKNKVIKHIGKTVVYNNKKCIPVIIRYRRNIADFIGIETSEKTVYFHKNILGFYRVVR